MNEYIELMERTLSAWVKEYPIEWIEQAYKDTVGGPTTKNNLGVASLFVEFKEKLSKWLFHNGESVCGNNMIDIDYLEGHIDEMLYEMGIIGEVEE